MSTAQDVIDLAAMRSQLNDSSLINPTTLIKAISRYERLAFIRAARIDTAYFGATGSTATRASFTAPWSITTNPGPMAAVTSVYASVIVGSAGVAVGDRVNLVDLRFPDVEIAPRAYIRGRQLYGYKSELGSADSDMVTRVQINYAQLPADLTGGLTSALTIPEEWIDLVVLPIAKLMCLRDRRPDDAQLIDAELKDLYELFEQAVVMFAHGAARPIPSVLTFPPQLGQARA